MAEAASTIPTWRVGGQIDQAAITELGVQFADITVTATLVGSTGQNVVDPTNQAHVLRGPYVNVVGGVAGTATTAPATDGSNTIAGRQWWTHPLKATTAADPNDALQPSGLAWSIAVTAIDRRNVTHTLGTFTVAINADRNYTTELETITVPGGTGGADVAAIAVGELVEPPAVVANNTFDARVVGVLDDTPGLALPAAGTTGQALTKASNTDYDVAWATIAASGGDGLPDGWFVADDTYGIVADGVTDDTAGFQAWINAMAAYVNTANATGLHRGVVGIIPPGIYYTTGTITIPQTNSASSTKLVRGYGATIRAGGAVPVFATTVPADNSAADSQVSLYNKWRWEGLTIDGSRIVGSKAFHVRAVGRWVIDGCVFQDLDRAYDAEFMLGSEFVNCQFSNSNLTLLRIENGTWTGSTPGNSASNMTRVNHCRFLPRNASEVALYVDQSGGISVRDCTFEGGNPAQNVWLSPAGNNSAMYVEVLNCWFENTPTSAHVRLEVAHRAVVGFAYVQGGPILIDATGSGSAAVIEVQQWPYGASATYGANAVPCFTQDAANDATWMFRSTPNSNRTRVTDPTLWTGGVVPSFLRNDAFGAQNYPTMEYTSTLSVTGSAGGNAALQSLLTQLAKIGVIANNAT